MIFDKNFIDIQRKTLLRRLLRIVRRLKSRIQRKRKNLDDVIRIKIIKPVLQLAAQQETNLIILLLRNKVSFELHPSFDAKPHTVNNSPNKLVAYDGNLKEINLYNTNDKIREFPLVNKDLPEHVGKESKSSDSNKGNKAKESFLQTNTQGPATLDQSFLNKSMNSMML